MRISDWSSDVCSSDLSGDSGQIEDIQAHAGDQLADIPTTPVEIARLDFHATEPERLTEPLSEAIETLAYAFLEQTHGGWENNEGAFGEFVFDVAGETITLDYNERVETPDNQIGRASRREKVCPYVLISVVAVYLKNNNKKQTHT